MGLLDIFKSTENEQLKNYLATLESENDSLKKENEDLNSKLTPEIQAILDFNIELKRLETVKSEQLKKIKKAKEDLNNYYKTLYNLKLEINEKQMQCVSLDEELMCESFGLYKPRFDFAKSELFLVRLEEIRRQQKDMIVNNTAVSGNEFWTINGNATQGKKMVKDMQKLLLRAFNGECDDLIAKVKYNNFEASLKKINASCDAISKLGTIMQISISSQYRQLKIEELTLAFEYAQKKQEEKEKEKEIRAILREDAKLQKELEAERSRLEKEMQHYQGALERLNTQIAHNPDNEELKTRQKTLMEKVEDTEKALQDVDYREANKRAGYVYIISNIGAFGQNIFKIGMTRRLDPLDRIDELSGASVPFKFDVHAMIFSDDAPALEAALHRAFENKRVNMVNPRREFFKVSLEEIKDVVHQNYDKTVEFIEIPEAEQWRVSNKMRNESPNSIEKTVHIEQQTDSLKTREYALFAQIRKPFPSMKCEYKLSEGIATVKFAKNGNDLGILRYSFKGNVARYDYTNLKTRKISFCSDIETLKEQIMASDN